MAETTIQYTTSSTGEETTARNGRLAVRWSRGAELTVQDLLAETTQVAGGPFFELGPLGNGRRPRTVGLGLDVDGSGVPHSLRFVDAHGSGLQLRRSFHVALQPLTAEWAISLYDEQVFVRMELALRNTGSAPVRVRRIFPFVTGSWWGLGALQLDGRQAGFFVYKNGWQSWSYAGGLPPERADLRPRTRSLAVWHSPGGVDPRQPITGTVDVASEEMALLGHTDSRQALLAGFLSAQQWLGQIYVQRDVGALAACVLLDDCVLAPQETVRTPPLILAPGAPEALLSEYAAAVAREQQARSPSRVYTGWSSWYYYYTSVSEADITENLAALRTLRTALPLDVVELDDGYQQAVGDWLSVNEKFPSGLPALATHIREAGYVPGLWLAPFTVAADSALARAHPDWLVRDDSGQPVFGGKNWDTELYGLDTTHPEARAWLASLVATVAREWGFRYLKLDFLASAALPGRRHDPAATRAGALRDGLALIRETVGDDVFLLGCGCPLLSAVGLVDAMRIGPDSAPYWPPRNAGLPRPLSERHVQPSLEGAVRNTLTRAWMHPALWLNDPDCLLVREHDSDLTHDEVLAFASAVGLTGGQVMLSDRLSQLTLERIGIVSRLIPPMRERALPASVFGYGIPERVAVPIVRPWGQWLLLGLFNGEDDERYVSVRWSDHGLPRGEYHAVEFWSDTYLGRSALGVTVRVAPHGAAVLAVRADTREPQLLSTSFHISQGAVEIEDWQYDSPRREIRWRARIGRQALGTFTLWLPPGLLPVRLESSAASATWTRGTAGDIRITAEIREEASFVLELESDA